MGDAKLFGIKNDSATLVAPCEPWAFVPNVPTFDAKGDYVKWRGRESTDHLLFNGAEGTNADLRPNKKTNPIRRLHALVGDYDADIADVMEEAVTRNAPADLRPNWISTTFSGGRRLVWLFEEPLPFDDVLAKRFLEVAGRELQASTLLPGLDSPSWLSTYKFYDVGTAWRQLSDTPLSTKVLHFWLTEASKKTDWSKVGELHIPLADVEEQLHKQFPGAWDGEFAVGARGPVFWEGRSNPSAGVVTEAGMLAFSSHKLFHTWAEIFGAAFVKRYQADKVGSAIVGTWFDGKQYYRKIDNIWVHVCKEDFQKVMRVDHGLDSSRGKHETASEVDRAEVFVQKHRRVAGVVPRLFDQRDVVDINGQKFLNSAYIRPVQPAECPQEWGVNFRWISEFIDTCFDPFEQKDYFLAWLKRFYGSALAGDLLKGQALFIVGPVKKGKTLLSNLIIGASVGGFADASDYVTKGSEFNRNLADVACWVIDDGGVSSDPASQRKFGELVKRLVANPTLNVRAMYRDPQTSRWDGRLVVTLNPDAASLQMLPDLDMSIVEKISVFNFADVDRVFPPKHVLEPMIASELPAFCRWLSDWSVPAHVVGDSRLGVKAYLHEEVRAKALHSGQAGDLLELISIWSRRAGVAEDFWEGSSSEWLAATASDEILRPLVSKFTPRVLGKRFSEASRIPGSGVSVVADDSKHGNRYRVELNKEERKAVRIKP